MICAKDNLIFSVQIIAYY